jgi:hypothetical protein
MFWLVLFWSFFDRSFHSHVCVCVYAIGSFFASFFFLLVGPFFLNLFGTVPSPPFFLSFFLSFLRLVCFGGPMSGETAAAASSVGWSSTKLYDPLLFSKHHHLSHRSMAVKSADLTGAAARGFGRLALACVVLWCGVVWCGCGCGVVWVRVCVSCLALWCCVALCCVVLCLVSFCVAVCLSLNVSCLCQL